MVDQAVHDTALAEIANLQNQLSASILLTDQLGEPTPAVDSENNQDTDSGNNDTSTVEPQSHGYGLRPKNKSVQYAE